ncbi:MM3350-like domain-containing protein [Suillus paluster]|uniref:MM3350-like domain-containing protein n=1 Tax=Suillus paluster TaxID=48578 RepID=UPI001B884942|nr:MM3350-like domain-containing protein [Suillus paluster]KAG1747148.1 MM3350-like domain-containing protein [Suillus paluster]
MPTRTYIFKVDLLESRDPQISRTFSIPASWTFQKLHAAIQHVFMWQNEHLHVFTFQIPIGGGRNQVVSIQDTDMMGRDDEGDDIVLDEKTVKLKDVWEESGRYRKHVTNNRTLGGCFYEYDFGDAWEHEITLLSTVMSNAKEVSVLEVSGCAPLENSHGVMGWEGLKRAFADPNPNDVSLEARRLSWLVSPLGGAFHPSIAPTTQQLNIPGLFDRRFREIRKGLL